MEKTSKIIESNPQPTPPFLLNHVLKCPIYTFFKPLQGWGLHHLPGQGRAFLSSLAAFLFSPNLSSDMLTLCSTYIAKENLSAFLSSSLSFLPPTAALCQSYPQPGRPVALWLAFLPAPLASRVAKILFSSVPSMKILFLFFNASCQISVPSFHQAKLSALQKNGCLFFTLYINYCFNQKRLDSTITPCAQRPHDARGRAGYDTR